MATHSRAELESFMVGEGRMVYARYRDRPTAEPYFLVDRTASDPSVRELTKDLECLIPGCTDRRLKLVDRHRGVNQRRDGFSHYGGAGDHGKESLFHANAKSMIERWVRANYPTAGVRGEQWSRNRDRRADVMVTLYGGRQIAFEVQYSALRIGEWLTRHQSYRAQGIIDVWLFGNVSPQFKPVPVRLNQTPDVVKLSDLHRTCLQEKVPVFFINPMDAQIVTLSKSVSLGGHERPFSIHPSEDDTSADFTIESFDETCRLDPAGGLVTPRLAVVLDGQAAYDRALAAIEEAKVKNKAEIDALIEKIQRGPVPHGRLWTSDERRAYEATGRTPSELHAQPFSSARPKVPFRDRPRPAPLTEEQLEAKKYCNKCGRPLPHWKRGGSCPLGCASAP